MALFNCACSVSLFHALFYSRETIHLLLLGAALQETVWNTLQDNLLQGLFYAEGMDENFTSTVQKAVKEHLQVKWFPVRGSCTFPESY